jgi:hypothetical protein
MDRQSGSRMGKAALPAQLATSPWLLLIGLRHGKSITLSVDLPYTDAFVSLVPFQQPCQRTTLFAQTG